MTTYPSRMDARRKKMSRTIVISTLLLFVLLGVLSFAYGEPTHETATSNGAKVTLYSDKCARAEIANLPLRATWTENGKVIEGCFGVSPFGLLVFWFSDKTVFDIPVEYFKRVTGA